MRSEPNETEAQLANHYRTNEHELSTVNSLNKRKNSKTHRKFQTDRQSRNVFDNIMPAPEVISQELMNHFGGRELTEIHEMRQVQRMTTLSN